MGRMEDALKKAAEDRERVRHADVTPSSAPAPTSGPTTAGSHSSLPPTGALFADRLDERLVMCNEPQSPRAEEFRRLRANLAALTPFPRVLAIAAPTDRDGADIIAANVAIALAEARNGKVLLVDGDLRRSALAKLLAAPSTMGLSELITQSAESSKPSVVATVIPNLDLMPAGSQGVEATRQIRSGVLKSILDNVLPNYAACVVLIPAVDGYADGRVLAADTDGVVLVSRIGGSDRQALKRAYEALMGARARVLGTVAFGE